MRIVSRWTLGATFAVVLAVTTSADTGRKFVITDDCDPNAADWVPAGGCFHDSGEVSRAEFQAANNVNRYPGHPSWRIVPPYVAEQNQEEIRVENTGGRGHTFTEVARFGGGFVAGLNPTGATPVSECAIINPDGTLAPAEAAIKTSLAPGAALSVPPLAPGTHNFQCCIHPWMRTTVKVNTQ